MKVRKIKDFHYSWDFRIHTITFANQNEKKVCELTTEDLETSANSQHNKPSQIKQWYLYNIKAVKLFFL